MSSLKHLFLHFQTYGMKHRHLYLFSLMFLFWALFDGIISYITPLVITEEGASTTVMGLIYASSSVFGAIFDLVLSKYLKNTTYRRILLVMFVVCFVYPLILWQSKSLVVYILAMAMWGLYYDLINFGTFDFVGRKMAPSEHVSSFGVIDIFRAVGHIIAPILAGLVIFELVDWKSYTLAWIFLGISALIFLALSIYTKKHHFEYIKTKQIKAFRLIKEFHEWKHLFRRVWPAVATLIVVFIVDAFFWTLGPLFSEEFSQIHPLNGMFMAAYSFPIIIVGWFVNSIQDKFGKSKTTYFSMLVSFIILSSFTFLKNQPVLLFVTVLIFSAFNSITVTSAKGSFADYIVEKPDDESELEAMGDMSMNVGYVIGPAAAGFLSDVFGNIETFSILGIIGLIISISLFLKTRSEI